MVTSSADVILMFILWLVGVAVLVVLYTHWFGLRAIRKVGWPTALLGLGLAPFFGVQLVFLSWVSQGSGVPQWLAGDAIQVLLIVVFAFLTTIGAVFWLGLILQLQALAKKHGKKNWMVGK